MKPRRSPCNVLVTDRRYLGRVRAIGIRFRRHDNDGPYEYPKRPVNRTTPDPARAWVFASVEEAQAWIDAHPDPRRVYTIWPVADPRTRAQRRARRELLTPPAPPPPADAVEAWEGPPPDRLAIERACRTKGGH